MENDARQSSRIEGASRGATLVLVLLVMLGISALSVMALNSVSRSVEQSGVFRVRTQASQLSSSVATVTNLLMGQPGVASQVKNTKADLIKLSRQGSGSYLDSPLNTGLTGTYTTKYNDEFYNQLFQGAGTGTTGLLTDPGTSSKSFEDSLANHSFSAALEPSSPMQCGRGAADKKNCIRVVMYTRSQLGQFSNNWKSTQQQVGVGRHIVESKVRVGQ
jgi:hypothetical protein